MKINEAKEKLYVWLTSMRLSLDHSVGLTMLPGFRIPWNGHGVPEESRSLPIFFWTLSIKIIKHSCLLSHRCPGSLPPTTWVASSALFTEISGDQASTLMIPCANDLRNADVQLFHTLRFLDQFALDLRTQRSDQPPGGPVPCTTADVKPTVQRKPALWYCFK